MLKSTEQYLLGRLEKMAFDCAPADVDGRQCRAFAKKTAAAMLETLKLRLEWFERENATKAA